MSNIPFKSVLVTGGSGYLGACIIARLIELEPACSVASLDNRKSSEELPGVAYHLCDITDTNAVQALFAKIEGPHVIFHTASPPFNSHASDEAFWKVIRDGTNHILEAAIQKGSTRAFVFTSSSSVVHDNASDLIEANETLPLLKSDKETQAYTASKALAEEATLQANRKAGMLTCSIRPTTIFGPNQDSMLGKVVDVCLKGNARFQMGEGKNLYDFTYINNCVDAHMLAAQALLKAADQEPLLKGKKVEGEAFFISNDEHIPFWQFTLMVSEALGKSVRPQDVIKIPYPVAVCMAFLAEWITWAVSFGRRQSNLSVHAMKYTYMTRTFNIEKAKNALGYCPSVNMQDGIQRGVQWYIDNKKTR